MENGISFVTATVPPSRHPSTEVVALHVRLFCSMPWNMRPEKVRSLLQTMYDSPGFYGVFAYGQDGNLVGVALAAIEKKGDISFLGLKSLVVSPAFHAQKIVGGKSIGQVLTENVIKEGAARELPFVELATRRGGAAEKLYEKLGFKDEPCDDSEWRIMRRGLTPCAPSPQESPSRQQVASVSRKGSSPIP